MLGQIYFQMFMYVCDHSLAARKQKQKRERQQQRQENWSRKQIIAQVPLSSYYCVISNKVVNV